MSDERILNVLVLADVALGASSLALDPGRPVGPSLLFAEWMAMVCATILGWVGLVNLIRAGRAIYLASWLGYLALAFVAGPDASRGLHIVQLLMALVGGATLAMAYLSPLRGRFTSLAEAFSRP